MSYSSPSVHDLHRSTLSTAKPDPGTALDVTVPQTATISPETSSFNSTKIPDMASTGPGMSTMLLSFGIITVIGLAVAMAQEEFFQKSLRKPGNSQKFPRAASSVCSSQNKAVEAQSLSFFPAQADRGSVYQEEEEVGEAAAPAHAHVQLRSHRGTGRAGAGAAGTRARCSFFPGITQQGAAAEPGSPAETEPPGVH